MGYGVDLPLSIGTPVTALSECGCTRLNAAVPDMERRFAKSDGVEHVCDEDPAAVSVLEYTMPPQHVPGKVARFFFGQVGV